MIEFGGLQVAGLYLFLKEREQDLDGTMKELAENIESYLYERLSIQEMEELNVLYEKSDRNLASKI